MRELTDNVTTLGLGFRVSGGLYGKDLSIQGFMCRSLWFGKLLGPFPRVQNFVAFVFWVSGLGFVKFGVSWCRRILHAGFVAEPCFSEVLGLDTKAN